MQTDKALEIWTAQTLCDVGILLSVISLLLHIGRPYFERVQARLPLRVAADFWWLLYIILRDGTLFATVIFGLFTLNPDLMADIKIGLPFIPLGTVALSYALSVKVFNNAEDINRSYRLATFLVAAGVILNTIGFVLVMEAPGEEYGAGRTVFWQTLRSWQSNKNPDLSMTSFHIAILLLFVIAVDAFVKAIRIHNKPDTRSQEHPQVHKGNVQA
jgi:hypothetical protein